MMNDVSCFVIILVQFTAVFFIFEELLRSFDYFMILCWILCLFREIHRYQFNSYHFGTKKKNNFNSHDVQVVESGFN